MGAISKILSKINKAKSAINSLKGIGAKLESLNYTSQVDKLGEQAEHAQQLLKDRRSSLEKSITSANERKDMAANNPAQPTRELLYPINDLLPNYIVFTTRPRKQRGAGGAENTGNLLSGKETVEIMLYVPDGISSDTSVAYVGADIGAGSRRINQAIETVKNTKGTLASVGNSLEAGGEIVGAIAEDAIVAVGNTMTGGIANIKAGRAINPMKEQGLQGSDFRTFSFSYEFWPKNQAEANMVNQIIYTFRTAMLPDTFGHAEDGEIQNYLNYPNIFDVEFEGPISRKIDGFLPMVCTGCSVDHFNGQKVATFANGQPVSSSMKLDFAEIKVLSQESYQEISPFVGEFNDMKSMDSIVDNSQEKTTKDSSAFDRLMDDKFSTQPKEGTGG